MKATVCAALLIPPLLAALPASAGCSIEVAVENQGTGALEIRPEAFDSGVHLLDGGAAATGGPGGFADWSAATVLEPGGRAVQVLEAPDPSCGEPRRFQMAYRCLAEDVKGIAFAAYPPEDGASGSVTVTLTRCE